MSLWHRTSFAKIVLGNYVLLFKAVTKFLISPEMIELLLDHGGNMT